MSKFIKLAIILLVLPLLTQCVSSRDLNTVDLKIRNLNNQLRATGKGRAARLDEILRQQAAMSNRLDQLNTQMLQVKGQLEAGSHNDVVIQGRSKELKKNLNQKINDLAEQIALLTDQLNQSNERLAQAQEGVKKAAQDALDANRQALGAQARAEKAAAVAAAAERRAAAAENKVAELEKKRARARRNTPRRIIPSHRKMTPAAAGKIEKTGRKGGTKTSISKGSAANKLYNKGLALFRKSKFKESYRTFKKYITLYPKGRLAPNSRFWMGDCYYSQQEYELAILEYQKVIADYPKNPKAPAALLKQGLAFEKLQDKKTAAVVYKKLLAKYAGSSQAAAAKKRLAALK
ncbi:Cell division coordinator CpoB [hydrothermal vent metagenome]|uniref:Cell division coordinator CpoB n=1 Tax=hydrothermal vent metagenome TaxID=652676 RepID=A0A3B0VGF4_9ZZZZ